MTAAPTRLHAVEGAPETPIADAAASGSRRDLLVALRDRIALDIDGGVAARDLASLSRRLLEVTREIEEIDRDEEDDDLDLAAAVADEAFSPG